MFKSNCPVEEFTALREIVPSCADPGTPLADVATERPSQKPTLSCEAFVVLDFEDLADLKPIGRHFESQGVTFAEAVVLRPSNPAFPPHSGYTTLLGPRESQRPIEAVFLRAVSFVGAWVTASRPVVLSAYDSQGKLLAKALLPQANLGRSDSALTPNYFLSLQVPGIHRATFVCNDGNVVLDDFTFYPALGPLNLEDSQS